MEEVNATTIAVIKYPRPASLIAATAAITFVIFGVIGNALTIIALSRSPKLKLQATTWFVVSLSVSDMIFCSFNLPLTATRFIYEAWIFDDFLCKIFPFFFYANFGASLYHIMLIAMNRYALISNYITYKQIYKPRNVVLMIISVWAISFCLLLPPLLGVWGNMGLDEATFSCTILKKDGKSPKKLLFLFGILPPFLIVMYCYAHIIAEVRRSKKVIRRTQERAGVPLNPSASLKKDEMKLTKTMILLFACFILCFLPLMIVNVVEDQISYPWIHVAASILAWASAIVNPVIYVVTSKSYRYAYASLLGLDRQSYVRPGATATGKTTTSDAAIV